MKAADVSLAADKLRQGAVIAYPTEAVWGLGCDPQNRVAVERLLALKNRDPGKGLILIAATMDQLSAYLTNLDQRQRQMLLTSWPGPVTWLVPDNGAAPPWIRGDHDSVALRVTRHPVAATLCRAFGGPLISTSANPQGAYPAKTKKEVEAYFKGAIDYICSGPLGKEKNPSEIRNLATGKVVRPG